MFLRVGLVGRDNLLLVEKEQFREHSSDSKIKWSTLFPFVKLLIR